MMMHTDITSNSAANPSEVFMTVLSFPTALENKPALRGSLAAKKQFFGEWNRYAVAPVHTRFDAIEWFVWDAEQTDGKGLAEVVRQAGTLDDAISGLA